ncbi:ATP-binding protein [Streptomyces sp. NBC_00223]
MAVALAVAACRPGHSIYFISLDDMVRHLKAAGETGPADAQARHLPAVQRPGR